MDTWTPGYPKKFGGRGQGARRFFLKKIGMDTWTPGYPKKFGGRGQGARRFFFKKSVCFSKLK